MFEAHELLDDELFDAYMAAGATYLFYSAPGPDYSLDGLQLLLDWRARRSGQRGQEFAPKDVDE